MSTKYASINLAIVNETGEGPKATLLRALENGQPVIAPVSVAQTKEGIIPLTAVLSSFQRYGGTFGSIGAKARFAGQEGETPLNQAIRTL